MLQHAPERAESAVSVAPHEPVPTRRSLRAARRRWRPGALTIVIAALALAGLVSAVYPMTAQWLTAYNQAQIVGGYNAVLSNVEPSKSEQLRHAQQYNQALSAGAVLLRPKDNKPVVESALGRSQFDYAQILSANAEGLMGRVRIPTIGADLPIYHGTSDEVLLRGAGHLEGSHFPIGGVGTRSVITAHRGLANAAMFTDLNRVAVGDTFTVEVFDQVLTYQVNKTETIEPDDSGTLRPDVNEDLVTLITCTPLGVNSHRILVTGERITPTPIKEMQSAGSASEQPGAAWWAAWTGGGLLLLGAYVARQGFVDARMRDKRAQNFQRGTIS